MPTDDEPSQIDAAIVGGGIAGAWLLNLLTAKGYHVVLLERGQIGGGQTLASQGMIHGGLKYALGGALNRASEAIAHMPARWRRCLEGDGDIDLRGAHKLADAQYMFAATASGRFATLLGSLALRGRVEKLKPEEWPQAFVGFSGAVYRLDELVLDTESLLRVLVDGHEDRIFQLDCNARTVARTETGFRVRLDDLVLNAHSVISCAGNGADALLADLGVHELEVQRRPLKQVIVRPRHRVELFGHCLTDLTSTEPRLTVSTHPAKSGVVWYLGGMLAISGVDRTDDEQIAQARKELATCVDWLDWDGAEYSVLSVDRAEPSQAGGLRPDEAFVRRVGNFIQCFPTKLTLTPDMGDKLLDVMDPPKFCGELVTQHRRARVGRAPWA